MPQTGCGPVAAPAEQSVSMTGFAVFDIETTGLHAGRDRITEIGVLLLSASGREEAMHAQLVHPGGPIPAEASRLTGITDAMVANSPRFEQIAGKLAGTLSGRVLVGHNIANFDIRFLQAEFAAAGVSWQPGEQLDTLPLARRLLPSLGSHKLAVLCDTLGITNRRAHRAEGDIRATWELLCALAAADVDDIGGLSRFRFPPTPASVPDGMIARRADASGDGSWRPLRARFAGRCATCGEPFPSGASVLWNAAQKQAVCAAHHPA